MCARYTLTAEEKEILKAYPHQIQGEWNPNYNLAITQKGLVITADEPDIIQQMAFGIVPHFALSLKLTRDTWNIKSETAMESGLWRPLLKFHKTCLVMADGFYEWKELAKGEKQPYRFTLKNRKLFCFAGLWSQWMDAETGEKFRTYGILTTEANPLVAQIHSKKRMPVILTKPEEEIWLSKSLPLETKMLVLDTFPEEEMKRTQVGKRVNAVSTLKKPNNDPDLLSPLNTDEDL
ncbi:SOS response-associated peptidase [Pedobacter jamesrossensis]|uniref:Abasic site processing protein n=1 Tax=Pedobacter jamesrossensis TaxID=1908238 RepID=A0ABV8NM86_9SPHI